MNWLRDMGPYDPGPLPWIISGGALTAFAIIEAWWLAGAFAGLIVIALVLRFLRQRDGPVVVQSWAMSRRRATLEVANLHDIQVDKPLIGVAQDAQFRRGYAWAEYDPETSMWDMALLTLRWHSFHRQQYFSDLNSEEFRSHVDRVGLKFLPQDDYAETISKEYFDMDDDELDPEPPTGDALDERAAFIADLCRSTLALTGRYALVEDRSEGSPPVLAVEPVNPRAHAAWVVADHEMDVQIGDSNARWTVPWTADGQQLVRELIRSVILGRGAEVHSAGRIDVEVLRDDGSVSSASAHDTLLSYVRLPGWRRRSRRIDFVPYR
jgi:hypothetical protein